MRAVEEIKADIAKIRELIPPNYANSDLCELAAELVLAIYCDADISTDELEQIMTARREGRMWIAPIKVGEIICDNGRGYDWMLEDVGALVKCGEDSEWYTLAELKGAIDDINREKAEAQAALGAER